LIALVGVLVLGILPGLLITVALSVLLLLNRISRPPVSEIAELPGAGAFVATARHAEARSYPGLMIVRPDAPLLFVNAAWIRDEITTMVERTEPKPQVVILDLEGTSDIDLSSIDALTGLRRDLEHDDIALWLAGVHSNVHELLDRSELSDAIQPERIYSSVSAAKSAFAQKQGK
jgi:MFS superfamily sulfate permease-like transporter